MKKLCLLFLLLYIQIIFGQKYISVSKEGQLINNGKPYNFIGANYWYGPMLPLLTIEDKGVERLKRELDFLAKNNVKNLRVVIGVEGEGFIQGNARVEPPYMISKNTFNDEVLKGLDVFMDEASKRDIKIVLALSNMWEWSGGWMQYLYWNNQVSIEQLQNKANWEELRDLISKFYTCEPCISQYREKVKRIITRANSINGKKYTEDETLMAWQIANEPRPMRPHVIPQFIQFISETAAYIKLLDQNHLVSIGSEGYIGSENMDVFKEIHSDRNIDYLTIHIWPRNWDWIDREDFLSTMNNGNQLTIQYINDHISVARDLKKPLLIEEFGFPRDNHSFSIEATTNFRNQYFQLIFDQLQKSIEQNGPIYGVNFWAFGGEAKPINNQIFWKKGDDYIGDPPFEEQGLYSVFRSDKETWKLIKKMTKKFEK